MSTLKDYENQSVSLSELAKDYTKRLENEERKRKDYLNAEQTYRTMAEENRKCEKFLAGYIPDGCCVQAGEGLIVSTVSHLMSTNKTIEVKQCVK